MITVHKFSYLKRVDLIPNLRNKEAKCTLRRAQTQVRQKNRQTQRLSDKLLRRINSSCSFSNNPAAFSFTVSASVTASVVAPTPGI